MRPFERGLQQAVSEVFGELKDEAVQSIEREYAVAKSYTEKGILTFFNISKAIATIQIRVLGVLRKISESSTEDGLRILHQTFESETWLERNARISKKYSEKISESINTLNENLKEDVRRILSRTSNETPADRLTILVSETENKFDNYYTKERAKTIARTTTTAMDNEIKKETWRTKGVNQLEWVTEGDDRVRPSHQAMDGKRIDLDDKFNLPMYNRDKPTGEYVETPFPAGGQTASQDVNCRCTLLPVVKS